MARNKNLSKDDLEDVNSWESNKPRAASLNSMRISEIPISVKCLNEKQKKLKKAIEEQEIVIAIGPAGTGKTYLSLITALHLLKTKREYKKIVLIKSVQPVPGEELGFLPGTLMEKMEPYMQSFIGNLNKIFGNSATLKGLMESETIVIEPIAYIRGNTIDDSLIIIDETQNIDMGTFKTIITRIGKNSKMIFLGDVEQVDRKIKTSSCLASVHTAFSNSDFIGTVEFVNEECVRNAIIPKVLEVLNKLT